MKWHLIQHGFRDIQTHYRGEAQCWLTDMGSRQWQGYAHQTLDSELAQALNMRPCFTFLPDMFVDPDPVSREVNDLLCLSDQFALDCAQHITPELSGDDVVVVTYSTPREILGAAKWLGTLDAGARPRLVFVFHLPSLEWHVSTDLLDIAGSVSGWRFAANALRRQVDLDRVLICATNQPLAQVLSTIFAWEVVETPLILPLPGALSHGQRLRSTDVLCAGQFRYEKGSELLLDVLELQANRIPNLRFAIQVQLDDQPTELADKLLAMQRSGTVQLICGTQTVQEYTRRLLDARLVLLPYLGQRYRLRASAVAVECFAYGIPVVAPDQTWIATQLAEGRGSGTLFNEWSAAAIVEACAVAWQDIDALGQAAEDCRSAWTAYGRAKPLIERAERHFYSVQTQVSSTA